MRTATKSRPRVTREERHAEVKALAARLAAFRDSLDPAEVAVYEARFDNYSPRNAMLIVMQMPEATVVHGYREWKAHGRHVRKGEHSRIGILAPAGQYTETGADGQTETGEEKVHRFFKLVPVFDISQTDPINSEGPTAA